MSESWIRSISTSWVAGATLLILIAAPVQADPYQKLAKELSCFSGRLPSRRVAVLPFITAGGEAGDRGLALAERLTGHLVSNGRMEVIERTLLHRILEEQRLSYQGWLDPSQSKQLGKILGVDALVTGTYLHLANNQLEVNARIIDTENARIIGASSVRVADEWKDSFFSGANIALPPPNLGSLSSDWARITNGFRDSPAEEAGCSDWESRIFAIQNSVLELKARYWATRLRDKGFSLRTLSRNPGAEIHSLQLRQEFYARIRELYRAGYTAGIALQDASEIDRADRKTDILARRCDR